MPFELRLVLTIALILAISGAIGAYHRQDLVTPLFDWLQDIGLWSVPLFISINMAVVILVLPGVVVTVAAGFLFGLAEGALYVIVATSAGASTAFFIARRLLGQRWADYLRTHRKMRLIERDLARRGWIVVLLTRLIPFFPFKLSNYFFGVTSIRFSAFFFGTLVGIVPFTLTNVYVGSIAADLTMLGGDGQPRSQLAWAVHGAGLVVAVGAAIYIARLAQRTLAEDEAACDSGSDTGGRDQDAERH